MKTSTKIFVIYGSVIVALQLVFLTNSLVQYSRLKPLGQEMCKALDRTPIHNIEVDISHAAYCSDTRRWEGRDEGPWIIKSDGYRGFYVGANLATSHISNDTLYIKALIDDISWRPNEIPKLRSSTIITSDEVVSKNY